MTKFEYDNDATPLDPDEIDGLLLTHITQRGELDRWEQDNIIEAIAWVEKTKPKEILSASFVKKLHRRMFNVVWKWAGSFRTSDKNIGEPWQEIQTSLKNLFDDTNYWMEQQAESSDMIAVHFHHRLVSIHPFPNGNGRHARLMADLLLENVLQCAKFTWGSKDLSKTGAVRKKYITALHTADDGDYKLLLEFARS